MKGYPCTVSCSIWIEFICLVTQSWCKCCLRISIRLATVSNRFCNRTRWGKTLRRSSKIVTRANEISTTTSSQEVYCNHCLYWLRFGLKSSWISSMDYWPLKGKDVVFFVVDMLSKYSHFIHLNNPYSVLSVQHVFFEHVFILRMLPYSIVSDWDAVFTSSFGKELFKLQGTNFNLSSSYHPQTDGQTEVVNHALEMYLYCFYGK